MELRPMVGPDLRRGEGWTASLAATLVVSLGWTAVEAMTGGCLPTLGVQLMGWQRSRRPCLLGRTTPRAPPVPEGGQSRRRYRVLKPCSEPSQEAPTTGEPSTTRSPTHSSP